MDDPFRRPTFGPAVFYEDPFAALDWLEAAFGFERSLVVTDTDGNLAHSEMSFGDGYVMIGPIWTDGVASPRQTGGRNTQTVHVQLKDGIEAHHDRAVKAGAVITRPLERQFYGDLTYCARDPEGHVWSFGQTVAVVGRTEAEAASGLKIEGWFETAPE